MHRYVLLSIIAAASFSCAPSTQMDKRVFRLASYSQHVQQCEKIANRPKLILDGSSLNWHFVIYGDDMPERVNIWGHLRVDPYRKKVERWDPSKDAWVDDDVRNKGYK